MKVIYKLTKVLSVNLSRNETSLKKIIKKVKSSAIVKNDGKNFLHFFLAFTVIFVALAVIIIQVMQLGMYRATDQNLHNLAQNRVF